MLRYDDTIKGGAGRREATCRICGYTGECQIYRGREMMQGTREEFDYILCGHCGCLQIAKEPEDMGRYYGEDYYSFTADWRPEEGFKAPVSNQTKVLDVGCGSGAWLLERAKEGWGNLFGCDPFLDGDRSYGDRIKIYACSIHEMEGDRSFDLIRMHDSFEHMSDPEKVLKSANRLLKDDGILYMSLPIFPNIAFDNFGVDWYQLDAPRHIFLHSRQSLQYLADKTGLQICQVRYDSNDSQFVRSILYGQDISFYEQTVEKLAQYFTRKEWEEFIQLADEMNEEEYGDHVEVCYMVKERGCEDAGWDQKMGRKTPSVSVIIPTCNRRETLPRSIESVRNQTYTDWECLIVDDASTDDTEQYVKGLEDSRFRYVRNEHNIGAAASRNKGVQLAGGKYIAFQDSDDEWLPDKLEMQMRLIEDDNNAYRLIYCEMAWHEKGKFCYGFPKRQISYEKKTGDMYETLLINALISTQTMLLEREAFLSVGGFNERLQSMEDYEFSIRFAKKYPIGMVEKILVNVYPDASGVNSRRAEKIKTQMYIVESNFTELAERDLLWEKLSMVREEAEHWNVIDVFEAEMDRIRSLFDREGLDKMFRRARMGDAAYRNQWELDAWEMVSAWRGSIARLYQSIVLDGTAVWEQEEIRDSVRQFVAALNSYEDVFLGDERPKDTEAFLDEWDRQKGWKGDAASVLERAYKCMDRMYHWMQRHIAVCNVCGQRVFFDGFPSAYDTLRKANGFPYVGGVFQLEHRDRYACPICFGADRDRLMIAFLENVRPEDGERLRMLHVAPSPALEKWARSKPYIDYESTDLMMEDVTFHADIQNMDMVEDESYDILVCSHVLEHVQDDEKAMRELYRITKREGVCLVLVPLLVGLEETDEQWGCGESENWRRFGQNDHCRLYAKKDFIARLQKAGFFVNELGEDWFGKEFYDLYGFDGNSILYVGTKGENII